MTFFPSCSLFWHPTFPFFCSSITCFLLHGALWKENNYSDSVTVVSAERLASSESTPGFWCFFPLPPPRPPPPALSSHGNVGWLVVPLFEMCTLFFSLKGNGDRLISPEAHSLTWKKGKENNKKKRGFSFAEHLPPELKPTLAKREEFVSLEIICTRKSVAHSWWSFNHFNIEESGGCRCENGFFFYPESGG